MVRPFIPAVRLMSPDGVLTIGVPRALRIASALFLGSCILIVFPGKALLCTWCTFQAVRSYIQRISHGRPQGPHLQKTRETVGLCHLRPAWHPSCVRFFRLIDNAVPQKEKPFPGQPSVKRTTPRSPIGLAPAIAVAASMLIALGVGFQEAGSGGSGCGGEQKVNRRGVVVRGFGGRWLRRVGWRRVG